MTIPPPSSTLRVRYARPRDLGLVARLLPGGPALPPQARCVVAEDPGTAEALGAAYVVAIRGGAGRARTAFRFAATESDRAEEAGAALIEACMAEARASGAHILLHDAMVQEDTAAEHLLLIHGFTPTQTLTDYVMDVPKARRAVDSAWRVVERRGGIPPEGRVMALSKAPLHPVRQLITRYLGSPGDLDWNASGSNIRSDVSTVVQVGPRVVAALIVCEIDGQAEAPYDVVDEEFRKGWVTIALWRRTFHQGMEVGYETVRFKTNDENLKVFANFAHRMGAVALARESRYELLIQP